MKWKNNFILVFLVVILASVTAHNAKHTSLAAKASDVVKAFGDFSSEDYDEYYDESYEYYE